MIGGNWRIGRRTRFVTENHFWREGGFLSGGIRYGGERFFADFGVTTALFTDYPPYPNPELRMEVLIRDGGDGGNGKGFNSEERGNGDIY